MVRQKVQQLHLLRRHFYPLSIHHDSILHQIHRNSTDFEYLMFFAWWGLYQPLLSPAQYSLDSGNHFIRIKGLYDIIIYT
ncbi:hypothetical protein D3C73_1460830 [compost metagenome]